MSESPTQSARDTGSSEAIRAVSTVETLKALADPTRLRLLSALMTGPASAMPVMSVKELAAKLDEPQTKLYRHIKQLEAAGLIRVAATRVVSGIVEQRYQACQRDLMIGPGVTDEEGGSASVEAAIAAAFELYLSKLFAAQRAGLLRLGGDDDASQSHRGAVLSISEIDLPPARAAEVKERLRQLAQDLNRYNNEEAAAGDGSGSATVPVNVLIGYFSPDTPEG